MKARRSGPINRFSPKLENHFAAHSAKTMIRRNVLNIVAASGARVSVFDAFCGNGAMYSDVWQAADSYVGCDRETDETRAVVAIPDNYADLPWTAKEPGALTVRAIAASVSATPIINRKAAIEAIEAELARRADAKVKAEAAKQQSGAGPAADGE